MAGYVKHHVGQEYISKKLSGSTAVEQGAFLINDIANGEYDLPAANATGEVVFVANEFDPLVPHNYSGSTFTVAGGDFIKGKPIIQREEYVTTKVTANALAAAVGTELGVGTGGTLATIADLSVANLDAFKNTFVIIKKVKLNLVDALIVQAKVKA